MSAGINKAWLVGLVFAAPQLGMAQDREFPVLNSVGRYLGIGYTCGGYHAPHDGRLDIITKRHPAWDYRPGGLPQYSLPYPAGSVVYPDAPAVEVIRTPQPTAPRTGIPSATVPGASFPSTTDPSTTVPSSLSAAQVGPPGEQPVAAVPNPAPSGPSRNSPALTAAGLATGSAPVLPGALFSELPHELPRGLPPGVVSLPPPPTAQHLQIPQAVPPAVVTSPKDRIEVRDLAPPTTPGDVLLENSRSHRRPALGVTYSVGERPDGEPRRDEQPPVGQEASVEGLGARSEYSHLPAPSVPANSSSAPARPVANRYFSSLIPMK